MNQLFESVTDFLGQYGVLLLLLALLLVNFIGACVVLLDKRRSRAPRGSVRRVPEKCFVRFAAFGGGVGVLLSMLLVRHKTRSHNFLLLKITCLTVLWMAVWIFLLAQNRPL